MKNGCYIPAKKSQNHYSPIRRNSPIFSGYPPETVGKVQLEPIQPHAPEARIMVVLTNALK